MRDSFETNNWVRKIIFLYFALLFHSFLINDIIISLFQIVAVTDYAHEALYTKLATAGYLNEEQACKIVCDLVSALYYLHSNRVLHRLVNYFIMLDVFETFPIQLSTPLAA